MVLWNRFESEKYTILLIRAYLNLIISFCVSIRSIAYLRFVDGLRSLIMSIRVILVKMYFFILFMFSYIFVVIVTKYGKNHIDKIQFDVEEEMTFRTAFLNSLLLNFGEMSFPSVDKEEISKSDNWLQWIISVLHSLIVVVMMLNLLVGILSNVFDEFQENKEITDLEILIEMIKEADAFLSIFVKEKGREKFFVEKKKGMTHFEESK